MAGTARVGIIGDYDPDKPSHGATGEALEHTADALGVSVEVEWLPTLLLEKGAAGMVKKFDALWCAPGSPYESFSGALAAIRLARENDIPFIGTCGGFQHAVIEYARNVLGFANAGHAEYDPYASNLFVSALSCSPFGKKMQVTLESDSKVYGFYGRPEAEEEYRCNFGMDPERQRLIEEGGLHVCGLDPDGEARILEIPGHPFYVATLFVPQMNSTAESPHPLIRAFLEAALEAVEERKKPARGTEQSSL